jgi:hypothetical protein
MGDRFLASGIAVNKKCLTGSLPDETMPSLENGNGSSRFIAASPRRFKSERPDSPVNTPPPAATQPSLDDRMPWTGLWPGAAERREFGWYARMVPGTGWVTCSADGLDAIADLNRLHVEANWLCWFLRSTRRTSAILTSRIRQAPPRGVKALSAVALARSSPRVLRNGRIWSARPTGRRGEPLRGTTSAARPVVGPRAVAAASAHVDAEVAIRAGEGPRSKSLVVESDG